MAPATAPFSNLEHSYREFLTKNTLSGRHAQLILTWHDERYSVRRNMWCFNYEYTMPLDDINLFPLCPLSFSVTELQINEIFSSLLIARWPSIKSSLWLSLNCKGVALFRGHCRNSFFGVKASAHMNEWGNIAETDQISYYVSQTKNLSGQKTNVRQYCQRKGKGRWRREEGYFCTQGGYLKGWWIFAQYLLLDEISL